MMRKYIFLMLLSYFGCMQASSRPSSENSNKDNRELIEIDEENGKLLSQQKQQAVFFAIRKGVDQMIVKALLDASLRATPSQEFAQIMEQVVMRVYKTDSPLVRDLKHRISGKDGTRAVEREQLREQLEDILNS